MLRRPPRSTRTDTLFPYTTLFRSENSQELLLLFLLFGLAGLATLRFGSGPLSYVVPRFAFVGPLRRRSGTRKHWPASCGRSEERRVGKECVSPCRSRCSPSHSKKK